MMMILIIPEAMLVVQYRCRQIQRRRKVVWTLYALSNSLSMIYETKYQFELSIANILVKGRSRLTQAILLTC